MEQNKYGIKIPWPDTGYTWVTECGPSFSLKPVLFDTVEAAQKAAEVWGAKAQVERYQQQ